MNTVPPRNIAKKGSACPAYDVVFAVLLVQVLLPVLSFADDSSTHKEPSEQKAHHWRVITFAEASSSGAKKYPRFLVRPDDSIKGLCLDIDFRDQECAKPNMISARLYREDGETVDSVGGNLNAPVPEGVTVNPSIPGQPDPPPSAWTTQTSFP